MNGERPEYQSAKAGWTAAGLAPLWESTVSHKPNAAAGGVLGWRWTDLQTHIERAVALASPEDVERRVLLFADPALSAPGRTQTSRMLNAGLQILLPGEAARAHRHTIDAIRLVLQGSGAITRVDGQDCRMEPGDLILTPANTWHEHVHDGDQPIIWLDGLNGPMHRFLGTAVFETGPAPTFAARSESHCEDAAFRPDPVDAHQDTGATFFRYPYKRLVMALDSAPISPMGCARVRYVNPATGANAIPLMDLAAIRIPAGTATIPLRTNATTINLVLDGEGKTTCCGSSFEWRKNDVFVSPPNVFAQHEAGSDGARIFQMSDREIYHRLGLLQEMIGNGRELAPGGNEAE